MLKSKLIKVAIGIASIATVATLSACGSSQATGDPQPVTQQDSDNGFIQALAASGLPETDGARTQYIALAHTECQSLDAGLTVQQVLATGIESGAPTFSAEQVGTIVGTAIRFYCPQYTDAAQRAANLGGA